MDDGDGNQFFDSIEYRYHNDWQYRRSQAGARARRDDAATPLMGFATATVRPDVAAVLGLPGFQGSEVQFMDAVSASTVT